MSQTRRFSKPRKWIAMKAPRSHVVAGVVDTTLITRTNSEACFEIAWKTDDQ